MAGLTRPPREVCRSHVCRRRTSSGPPRRPDLGGARPIAGVDLAAMRDQGHADLDQPIQLAHRDDFLAAAPLRLQPIVRGG